MHLEIQQLNNVFDLTSPMDVMRCKTFMMVYFSWNISLFLHGCNHLVYFKYCTSIYQCQINSRFILTHTKVINVILTPECSMFIWKCWYVDNKSCAALNKVKYNKLCVCLSYDFYDCILYILHKYT